MCHSGRARHRGAGFGAWVFGPGSFAFGADPGAGPDPSYAVLEALGERALTAYGVLEELRRRPGWARATEGTVYPTLQMLEDLGYVVREESGGRRVYRATEEGKELLARERERTGPVREGATCGGGPFAFPWPLVILGHCGWRR